MASINFDAMCGHGAIAAALEMEVCRVMKYFSVGGWVNVPIMQMALRNAGKTIGTVSRWDRRSGQQPAVTIIQFLGPWMNAGVPIAARCQHRHWVASRGDLIWDCNADGWLPRSKWETEIVLMLMPKRGTGFEPFRTVIWI